MRTIARCFFQFTFLATLLPGQIASYVHSTFPAANATAVPTNTSISLNVDNAVLYLSYEQPAFVALASGNTNYPVTMTSITLEPGITTIVVKTKANLPPSTKVTFTITPVPTEGPPFSFSFTTGAGPDTTAPTLVGFEPPSGTTGVGVEGPFIARFNKRVIVPGFNSTAIKISASVYGGTVPSSASITPDGTGIVIVPNPSYPSFFYPGTIQLAIDPTMVTDIYGNAGQGIPQTAHYTTFVPTSLSGPTAVTFFPADGDTAVPTNASVRLLFDRALDTTTLAAGVTLMENGSPVPVHANAFAQNFGVELKAVNLLDAGQTFQVLVGAALLDQFGIGATQNLSFQFTTGTSPDTFAPAVVSASPVGPVSVSNPIVTVRVNKRIMPLAVVEYSSGAFALNASNGGIAIPAPTASLSADGLTLIVTPGVALTAGTYYAMNPVDLVDVTGTSFPLSNVSFTPGTTPLSSPPTVVAASPPDGSQNVSPSVPIQIAFSAPIGSSRIAQPVLLLENGQPVPVSTSLDSTSQTMTVRPAQLDPNAAYTLQLIDIWDVAGNQMAPVSIQFATGAAATNNGNSGALVSSTPTTGATGVDVNTTISATFASPLSPLAAVSGFSIVDSANLAYPAMAVVSGSTITVTPAHALPQNTSITVTVSGTTLTGSYFSATINFTTGINPDTTPFQITSISPPDGATIAGPPQVITLTFSKPFSAATLAGGIVVYSNGSILYAPAVRSNNDQTLTVTPGTASGPVTIVAASALTDMAGNPAAPFRASYTLVYSTPGPVRTALITRPASGSSGVSPQSPITWFFSGPVDLPTVQSSLLIVANGTPVPGSFQLSTDATILTFTPATQFPAGSIVRYFQRTPIFADNYQSSFSVAAAPSALILLGSTMASSMAANQVFEFEFSADVAVGQNLITITRQNTTSPIAVVESIPRPHCLRLTPISPLVVGQYYNVVLAPGVSLPDGEQAYLLGPTISAPVSRTTVAPPVYGPIPGATGVPLNASVRAAFGIPIDPLSVTDSTVTLQAAGQTLPTMQFLAGNNRGLIVTPTLPLPPNAQITVTVTGLEDEFGDPIPIAPWNFTTGAAADFTTPVLLMQSVGDTQTQQIGVNEPVIFVFDRPMDPQIILSVTATVGTGSLSYVTGVLSGDLRTLTVTATPFWPRGQTFSISPSTVFDLSGNGTPAIGGAAFTVAFDTDTTAPQLLAASPADGQTGLPLNTQIIADFDKPVLSGLFSGIQLLNGAQAVPLVAMGMDLYHVRLSPQTPLQPNTTYTLIIAGVQDLSGNTMTSTSTTSFTTSDAVDIVALTAQVLDSRAPNVPIRLVFNKPVSPATVSTQTITLLRASNPGGTGSYYNIPIPSSVSLSSDGLTAVITPQSALTPGWPYSISANSIFDFAGNRVSGPISGQITAGSVPDTTPPSMLLTPPDGSTGVPIATRLSAAASAGILPQASPSVLQLSQNGQPLSGTIKQSQSTFTFVPDLPLQTSTTYQLTAGPITDLAGNVSAPVTSTFTTAASVNRDYTQLTLVSVNPANGSVGIPVDQPIAITFNKPVDPQTISLTTLGITTPGFPVSGAFSFSGNTVTFTPSLPWPAASSVSIGFASYGQYIQDLSGNRLQTFSSYSFKTAAPTSTTPPLLLGISPPAGTTVVPPSTLFRLTFSESVSTAGIAVFVGSQTVTNYPSSFDLDDPLTLNLVAPLQSGSTQVTITGSTAIVDRSGNPIAPFSEQYPVSNYVATQPSVSSVTPSSYTTNVTSTTPILIAFSKAMDPVSVLQSVRVTQNGDNFQGTLSMQNGNQAVQFQPSTPYQPGAIINVFVLATAADPYGLTLYQTYTSNFTVMSATAQARVVLTSFGRFAAPDGALEVAFDRPLKAAAVNGSNIWLRTGNQAIPGTVSLRGDRIIRFVPESPMDSSVEYVLTVGPGLGARPQEFLFHIESASKPVQTEVIEAAQFEDKPALHIHFSAPVSPLSLTRIRVLNEDGSEVPLVRKLTTDLLDLYLMAPDGTALRARSIRMDGLEDRLGRPLHAPN